MILKQADTQVHSEIKKKKIDQHDKIRKGTKICFGNKLAHSDVLLVCKKKKIIILKMEKKKLVPFCSFSLTSF